VVCRLRATDPVSSSTDGANNSETTTKTFYGSSSTAQQPPRPQVNNVRVYNGGAPVGFVDTPSNIHPISSLTPYQNRFLHHGYLLNNHLSFNVVIGCDLTVSWYHVLCAYVVNYASMVYYIM